MAVTLNPGQSVTETATAPDAAGDPDPNAVISWSESSGGTVVAISDVTPGNPSTALVTYVADGTAEVGASSLDPDGNAVSIGTNNPTTFTCTTPPPSTDAVSVDIVDGAPAASAPTTTEVPTAEAPAATSGGTVEGTSAGTIAGTT